MKNEILIGSTNSGKVIEIKKIFEKFNLDDFELLSLVDIEIDEPDEPFDNFLANARHKARYYGKHTGLWTISDDSGLSIHSLNGFPGVRTKDFLFESGGDINKSTARLAEMLKDSPDYSATFTSAISLYQPENDQFISAVGSCKGHLRFPPSSIRGYGYEPIFVPEGYDKPLSELGIDIKNTISHRFIALCELSNQLIQHRIMDYHGKESC